MTLDQDKELFADAIRATSDALGILPVYVEKDYWITRILQQLSHSKHAEDVVWKGGTSLSKGYGLISRFSSDIDIAVLTSGMSPNQIKNLISRVNKEMTEGLPEKVIEGETSKGSRYRKTYHVYDSMFAASVPEMQLLSNYVIVEINSFANPYPFERKKISSFISQFFEERGLQEQMEKYGMHPFELNVLDMRRTICEKTVSLLRYSFTANPVVGLRKKIRHFYDLHFLLRTIEGKEYLHGDFIRHLQELIRHDQAMFEEPEGWNTTPAISAPLLNNFDKFWQELNSTYEHELGMLAYKPIPPADEIKASMSGFIDFLKSNLE